MSITPIDLVAAYPKFGHPDTGFTEAEVLGAIAQARIVCPQRTGQEHTDRLLLLYTAHLLECEWQQRIQTAGAATAIAQGQAGQVGGNSGDFLDRTIYGQQYRELRDGWMRHITTGFVI